VAAARPERMSAGEKIDWDAHDAGHFKTLAERLFRGGPPEAIGKEAHPVPFESEQFRSAPRTCSSLWGLGVISCVVDVRLADREEPPFDLPQPDAGYMSGRTWIHRAPCAEFTIAAIESCCSWPPASATHEAWALWTRTCCDNQTRVAQRSFPHDDHRFPGPCL